MQLTKGIKRIIGMVFLMILTIGCHPKAATQRLSGGEIEAGQGSRRPSNVLLISIDTLRADHLGCYGYQWSRTPHIDQLAKEGALFTSCYTTVPITLPSHASLMTGQYSLTHGVRDNGTFRLDEESLTMAEIFQARGYRTAAFVGAFVLDSRFGLDQGFSVYDDLMDSTKEKADILYEERRAEEVIGSAINWLEQSSGKPFFLFVHCFDPHAPYEPPDDAGEGSLVCGSGDEFHLVPCYDGEISYVDICLGELFKKMKELGVYDDTLICFTSDHGESLGEHGEPSHAIFIYDSTIHIPLIIRCPRNALSGEIIRQQVGNIDIAPTILHLAGLGRENQDMQGRILLSGSSEGYSSLVQGDRPIYCESFFAFYNHHWSPLEGVRAEGWKYVTAPRPELYNLAEDPKEERNLYAQSGDQVKHMENLLNELKDTYGLKNGNGQSRKIAMDEDTRKRLEQLGYIWTVSTEPGEAGNGNYPDPKDMVVTLSYYNVGAYHYLRKNYDQAISSFRKSLKVNPLDVFSHFIIGFIYQKIGKFAEARDEFLECIRIDPAYVNGYIHLGGAYYELGDIKAASQQLEKALLLDPDSIEGYRNLGVLHTYMGEYDKAVEAYEQALKRDPGHADILQGLGRIYFMRKDYPVALQYLQRAVSVDARNVDAYNTIGKVYLAQGKISEAQKAAEYALTLDSQKAETHGNLAEIYIHQGEHDLARREVDLARQIDPNMANIYNCLGTMAVKEERYEEALVHFQKARNLEPRSSEIYYNLGISYVHLNDLDQAVAAFQQSIELDPNNYKAFFNLGSTLYRQHNIPQAIQQFQNALALEPGNIEVLFYLGIACQEMGHIDQAIAAYKEILDKDSRHINARIKLSLAYFAQGRLELGIAECNRILELDPANEVAHINLGLSFFNQKEFDRAIHEYQQAILANPQNPLTYYQLAYCHLWKQDIQKGIDCLQKALLINPDYEAARQLLNRIQSLPKVP